MRRTPSVIEPNLCPGGIVVRKYLANGVLMTSDCIDDNESTERSAHAGIEEVLSDHRYKDGFTLAFYDGDTGKRYPPDDQMWIGPQYLIYERRHD